MKDDPPLRSLDFSCSQSGAERWIGSSDTVSDSPADPLPKNGKRKRGRKEDGSAAARMKDPPPGTLIRRKCRNAKQLKDWIFLSGLDHRDVMRWSLCKEHEAACIRKKGIPIPSNLRRFGMDCSSSHEKKNRKSAQALLQFLDSSLFLLQTLPAILSLLRPIDANLKLPWQSHRSVLPGHPDSLPSSLPWSDLLLRNLLLPF